MFRSRTSGIIFNHRHGHGRRKSLVSARSHQEEARRSVALFKGEAPRPDTSRERGAPAGRWKVGKGRLASPYCATLWEGLSARLKTTTPGQRGRFCLRLRQRDLTGSGRYFESCSATPDRDERPLQLDGSAVERVSRLQQLPKPRLLFLSPFFVVVLRGHFFAFSPSSTSRRIASGRLKSGP